MAEFASKGVAGSGLGLGIAGTALGVLNGGLGNLFGGSFGNGNVCSDNVVVNRYDLKREQELASKDSEISLLKSNIYTDQKISDVYERLSVRIRGVEDQIAQQAVYNATNTGMLNCLQGQVAQLQGLTKLVIPTASICPEPMPRYNSFTVPTGTAPATAAKA